MEKEQKHYWTVGKIILIIFLIPFIFFAGCTVLFAGLIGFNQASQLSELKDQKTESINSLSVKISSVRPYLNDLGFSNVEVMGEIYNKGTNIVNKYQAEITISCYDKNEKLVGTDIIFSSNFINPGEKSPFKTYIDVSIPSSNVDNCAARIN